MNEQQTKALNDLLDAINSATDTGLLDLISEEHQANERIINDFCDLLAGL